MPENKQVQAQVKAEGTLKKDESAAGDQIQERKIVPEKTLFSWTAAARPFKKRDRDFWITIIAIVAISGLILFLVEGFMPVILIISIVFLFYILNTVEPENIEYKITNKGVKVAEKMNNWDTLNRFWFTKRFNSDLLVFESYTLGGRLELVINSKDKGSIKKELSKYLVEEEVSPSGFDKATNWFSQKLPGNK
jgi:hypothetical protein